MRFPCKKVSVEKLMIGPQGQMEPLCNSCINRECSNPIERKQISVFGVTKTYRLFCNSGNVHAIVDCEGYVPEHLEDKSSDADV